MKSVRETKETELKAPEDRRKVAALKNRRERSAD